MDDRGMTEAGPKLAKLLAPLHSLWPMWVADVEAQAATQEAARIRAAVDEIHPDGEPCLCVAAVLAIIDRREP